VGAYIEAIIAYQDAGTPPEANGPPEPSAKLLAMMAARS
jgi:hypothetical protein